MFVGDGGGPWAGAEGARAESGRVLGSRTEFLRFTGPEVGWYGDSWQQ